MGFGFNQMPVGIRNSRCYLMLAFLVILLLSTSVFAIAPNISDSDLLDQTEAKAAKYFYEQSLSNGLVKDTSKVNFSSIAATGFGLAAFTAMDERYGTNSNWTYTSAQLRARTNQILDTIITIQNNQSQSEANYGTHGILYHFIGSNNLPANGSEVSTIDTAILFSGVITAGEHFGGEVKQKATQIINKADWNYFLKTPQNNFTSNGGTSNYYQYAHAWSSSSGRSPQTWDRPSDETHLIALMALLTNPENTDFQKAFFNYPRTSRTYAGYPVVNSYFGSLFTYEFAHFFVDYNKIGADKPGTIAPGTTPVDWWQNSINAAKANRQFVINNSATYTSYGADSWGLSAVQKPNEYYYGSYGALPTDSGSASHDGTIAPYSSISTMFLFKGEDGGVLTNNLGFRVLRNIYDQYYSNLWGPYGPYDSFNNQNQFSTTYLGIDQGPIALSIENYRTNGIMNSFMENTQVKNALKKVFNCPNGVCDVTTIACSTNAQCNDNNSYTIDTCNSPGTLQSNCVYTPVIANCVVPVDGMNINTSTNFCGGTYNLNNITITKNGITLDCGGANINGTENSSTHDSKLIYVNGVSNVTIKNCNLKGSNFLIYINNSSSITITNNNLAYNPDAGINVNNSTYVQILNNKISNSAYQSGVMFNAVSYSTISDNNFSGNGNGGWWFSGAIYLNNNSSRNTISDNFINGNFRAFYIENSSNYNNFTNNSMCFNKMDVVSRLSSGNTASGNKLNSNEGLASTCAWIRTNSTNCNQSCIGTDYNYYLKGTSIYWDGLNTITNTDTCDGNNLTEFFCEFDLMHTLSANCKMGCADGACLGSRCYTDIGCNDNNIYTEDYCVFAGKPDSYCRYLPQEPIVCSNNSQCNDNNSLTNDICNSPGTTSSTCAHTTIAAKTVPGTIKFADFDTGGEGIAYHDSTPNNIGNQYRITEAVDITRQSPGMIIGWVTQGEWLKYTINVTETATYTFTYSTGSANTGGKFKMLLNGTDATGDITIPNTNSWTTYTNIQKTINLTQGINTLTIQMTQNGNGGYVGNFNTITITKNQTTITCTTNTQCDDSDSLTTDTCVNPGTTASTCTHTTINQLPLWSVSPSATGYFFNRATCNVATKTICPIEMGWEGNLVAYAFVLPTGTLSENLAFEFDVSYRNYGTSQNVILEVAAGRSLSAMAPINSNLEINKLGTYTVIIPKSYFTQGTTNYITVYGKNIAPIGYGTNPPNFQTVSVRLKQTS